MPNGLLRASFCRVAGTGLAVAAAVMLTGCGDSSSGASASLTADSTVGASIPSNTISPSTGNTTINAAASPGATITAGSSDASTASGNSNGNDDGNGNTTITTSETALSADIPSVGSSDALLYWNPPLQNTDGTQLADLAGYRLYAGQDPEHLMDVADLVWGGYLWVKFTDLSPGTWYFSIRSYNSGGAESDFAPTVSKEIA